MFFREWLGTMIFSVGLGLLLWCGLAAALDRRMSASSLQDNVDAPGTASSVTESRSLEPDVPIERELARGQVHAYTFTLAAGQYLRVTVAPQGLDVVARLFGPDGQVLTKVDSGSSWQDPLAIIQVVEITGTYRLEVKAPENERRPGGYAVRIAERREATAQDRMRVAAQTRLTEAKQLSEFRPTGKSKREALEKLEEALSLWRALADRGGEAATLHNIGKVYNSLGEKVKALEYYQKALPLRRAIGDRRGAAETLNNLGAVYDSLGERAKALDYYQQALVLRRAVGDRRGEASTLHNIGAAYSYLGEKTKALEYFENALSLIRAVGGDRYIEATTLTGIGAIYNYVGEMAKALDYYQQALLLRRAVEDRRGEAYTLHNMGAVYAWLEEREKALDYYQQALRLHRAAENRHGEADTLQSIGVVYSLSGEKAKALDYYEQALSRRRAVGDRYGEAETLANIGVVYSSLGQKAKALDYLQRALPLRRAVGDRRGEAYTLYNIGGFYTSLGERQKALDYYRQARRLWQDIGDRPEEALALWSIARVERDSGHLSVAQTHIEEAITIVESLRTKITRPELRLSYGASIQNNYEFYVGLLMQRHQSDPSQGYDAAALEASERARARSLLELLSEAGADIRQGIDPALLSRERTLQQQLQTKEQYRTQLLSRKHKEEQAAQTEKELRDLLTQYQEIQGQIRATSPRYAALTQPQRLSLRAIQQQVLDANTLLLEYALGDERSYLWAVTPTTLSSFTLPKRTEIEAAARQVYDLLTARQRFVKGETPQQRKERWAQAEAQYSAAAAALSRMLLEPVASLLQSKRLLIVGDGALQYVPFAALPAPDGRNGTASNHTASPGKEPVPLVAEHEIISLPSASVLVVLRRETAGRRAALKAVAVLADPVFDKEDARVHAAPRDSDRSNASSSRPQPATLAAVLADAALVRSASAVGLLDQGLSFPRLPFTRQEAKAILAAAPTAATMPALDFKANRATATGAELADYRMIHFATHGLLNSQQPELSGLVLSLVDEQGNPQNGFLRLYDIYNLNLSADLVVLSACQTGLGKEIKGEGLVGLTRGFMYAGAARVIASLWKVDDEAAAELMRHLYKGILKERRTPAAALRAAQVAIWKQARWKSPFYWGAFVLQGEWK